MGGGDQGNRTNNDYLPYGVGGSAENRALPERQLDLHPNITAALSAKQDEQDARAAMLEDLFRRFSDRVKAEKGTYEF